MRPRLSLVLLVAVLLSVLASSQAMAICYIECPDGSSCSTYGACCCLYGTAYCGPLAGNPCDGLIVNRASDSDAKLQASYAAIFAPATPPQASK